MLSLGKNSCHVDLFKLCGVYILRSKTKLVMVVSTHSPSFWGSWRMVWAYKLRPAWTTQWETVLSWDKEMGGGGVNLAWISINSTISTWNLQHQWGVLSLRISQVWCVTYIYRHASQVTIATCRRCMWLIGQRFTACLLREMSHAANTSRQHWRMSEVLG